MLKSLLKKQMMEINRSFFMNPKTGKGRTRGASIMMIVLYAFLMVFVIGGMFFTMAISMAPALCEMGLGWLYFAIMSLFGIVFGAFGSVFNTYSSLYAAKDNDLLLSLPIPTKYILTSRLLGVYLMGLMFSATVMVPAAICYWVSVPLTAASLLCPLAMILVVSLIVLILSTGLGWVVAKVSSRLKNKSLITVIVSLVFIGAYYYVYFHAVEFLQSLLENAQALSEGIRQSAVPLYVLGMAGCSPLHLLITLAVVALLAGLVWYLLLTSFLKVVTTTGTVGKKAVYKEKRTAAKSPDRALVGRELRHFGSSATYILNAAFASLLMPLGGVFLLIRGSMVMEPIREALAQRGGSFECLCCGAVCMIASMNFLTAPSVSLEGKNLWIVQSLPVSEWQVLRSKLMMHVLVTGIPAFFLSVCVAIAAGMGFLPTLLTLVVPQVFIALFGCFGLAMNLLSPNLSWTNETAVIKQSLAPLLCMLLATLFVLLCFGLYVLAFWRLSASVYLLIVLAASAALTLFFRGWLRSEGCRIFRQL